MTDDSAPQSGAPEHSGATAEVSATDASSETGHAEVETEEAPAEEAPAEEAPAEEAPAEEARADVVPAATDQAAVDQVQAQAEPRAAGRGSSDVGAGIAANAGRANRRKVREGLVLSIAMDKTAVVGVVDRVRHPRYAKTVQRTKRLYAHDENNDLRVGDRVRLAEVRPMSKLKRWRVVDVLERAK
jgi:small subunit ribosomal protein S17